MTLISVFLIRSRHKGPLHKVTPPVICPFICLFRVQHVSRFKSHKSPLTRLFYGQRDSTNLFWRTVSITNLTFLPSSVGVLSLQYTQGLFYRSRFQDSSLTWVTSFFRLYEPYSIHSSDYPLLPPLPKSLVLYIYTSSTLPRLEKKITVTQWLQRLETTPVNTYLY